MWNKRKKDEEHTTGPESALPTSAELAKEGIPMSTMPGRSSEAEGLHGSASIGKSVLVKGQIFSREDLYLDGEVEGSIELHDHRLTIGPNGKVRASVKAREVVARGAIQGNVEAADKIDIRKDAKLVGDIRTARIVIEDGAYFKGSIDIVKPEPAKPATPPRPQPSSLAATGAPHSGGVSSAPTQSIPGGKR